MTVTNERDELHKRCKDEGLEIMIDVFDIILDRSEATVEQIMDFLNREKRKDLSVFRCYAKFIAPGIDALSDHMAEEQERMYP